MFLPPNILNIINKIETSYDLLNGSYFKAHVVGGACRDALLGRIPKDYDIVTNATPDELLYILPGAKEVSESFPVVLYNDIEIATYRIDKGDHAEITASLKDDVIRRDFTINAVCYGDVSHSINNEFIDYVGGLEDIKNRILRFVGDPERRIKEDPVRILRGIRFASTYNLTIEKETYFEMCRLKELLNDIPKERIQLEIMKAFKSNNTHRFLTLLEEMEMLEFVFPSIARLRGIDGGGYHNEKVL